MKRFLSVEYINKILRRKKSTAEIKWPRQIFSAIQPTGEAHLGNYIGAIQKWVHLQNTEKNTVIFAIADLHSITIPKEPQELLNNIFTMTATLLACGIDTKKSILFQQSMISQHSELCWILTTMSTMAKLAHLPQYKEKSLLVKDSPVGIFLYPVLQAADIMLYRATHVPVGEDQIQQIEFANHLSKIFNNRFGETFPRPDVIIDLSAGRIKSLKDPKKKMSKSDRNPGSVISLMDEPSDILKKCKKALTDFKSEITYEPDVRPGVANLILIHSSLSGKSPQQIVKESSHLNTGQYKEVLAEVIIEHLNPIRQKIVQYLESKEFLVKELENGAEKARNIADVTLKEVKQKVGFGLRNSVTSVEEINVSSRRDTSAVF